MSVAPGAIRLLSGLREIADRYDGFLLDLWGVLHDGQRPYPGVLDCLGEMRRRGKRVVLLSNAPRRASATVARVGEIGIARELYDDAMTSGEDGWHALRVRGTAGADPSIRALGPRCLHLGLERDRALLDGLPVERVDEVASCDFILCTGLATREDAPAAYEGLLAEAVAAGRPMVCVNPDLIVIHSGRVEHCAGGLARLHERLGGRVVYHGKPYPSVYRRALPLLGGMAADRVLAVGDSLRTDIAGASGVGIDSLLVAGGIHADEFGGPDPDPVRIAASCAAHGLSPVAALRSLMW